MNTLHAKLAEHIDRIDTDMVGWAFQAFRETLKQTCFIRVFVLQALEYQVQQGIASGASKEELLLMPLTSKHVYGPELHSKVVVIKLLQEY